MTKSKMKRVPFSPVDGNRKRPSRKKRKPKTHTQDSISSILTDNTLSSFADDDDYHFLTNPPRAEKNTGKAPVAATAAWKMSSSKTPKITNCTHPSDKNSTTSSRLQVKPTTAASSYSGKRSAELHGGDTKDANEPQDHTRHQSSEIQNPIRNPIMQIPLRQTSRRKKPKRGFNDAQRVETSLVPSVAIGNTGLDTIIEGGEDDMVGESPPSLIKSSLSSQHVVEGPVKNREDKKMEKPKFLPHMADQSVSSIKLLKESDPKASPDQSQKVGENTPTVCDIAFPTKSDSVTNTNPISSHTRQKIDATANINAKKDGGPMDQNSDMDEASDDDLMELSFSPQTKKVQCKDKESLNTRTAVSVGRHESFESTFLHHREKSEQPEHDHENKKSPLQRGNCRHESLESSFLHHREKSEQTEHNHENKKSPVQRGSHRHESLESTFFHHREQSEQPEPTYENKKSPLQKGIRMGLTYLCKSFAANEPEGGRGRQKKMKNSGQAYQPENEQVWNAMMATPHAHKDDYIPSGISFKTPAHTGEDRSIDESILTQDTGFAVDLGKNLSARNSAVIKKHVGLFKEIRQRKEPQEEGDEATAVQKKLIAPKHPRSSSDYIDASVNNIESGRAQASAGAGSTIPIKENNKPMWMPEKGAKQINENPRISSTPLPPIESSEQTISHFLNNNFGDSNPDSELLSSKVDAECLDCTPMIIPSQQCSASLKKIESKASEENHHSSGGLFKPTGGASYRSAVMWTAECAGNEYKALGVNMAPVFKLNGGFFRHPPLPPGWTVGVSRSRNIPFYRHPNFGDTFYSPVPLSSVNGIVYGTSLFLGVDTPTLKSPYKQSSATPVELPNSGLPDTRHFYSFNQKASCEQQKSCPLESTSISTLKRSKIDKATPAGALAITTNEMYSEMNDRKTQLNEGQASIGSSTKNHILVDMHSNSRMRGIIVATEVASPYQQLQADMQDSMNTPASVPLLCDNTSVSAHAWKKNRSPLGESHVDSSTKNSAERHHSLELFVKDSMHSDINTSIPKQADDEKPKSDSTSSLLLPRSHIQRSTQEMTLDHDPSASSFSPAYSVACSVLKEVGKIVQQPLRSVWELSGPSPDSKINPIARAEETQRQTGHKSPLSQAYFDLQQVNDTPTGQTSPFGPSDSTSCSSDTGICSRSPGIPQSINIDTCNRSSHDAHFQARLDDTWMPVSLAEKYAFESKSSLCSTNGSDVKNSADSHGISSQLEKLANFCFQNTPLETKLCSNVSALEDVAYQHGNQGAKSVAQLRHLDETSKRTVIDSSAANSDDKVGAPFFCAVTQQGTTTSLQQFEAEHDDFSVTDNSPVISDHYPDRDDCGDNETVSIFADIPSALSPGDDSLSHLQSTPAHVHESKRTEISTRFKPTAVPHSSLYTNPSPYDGDTNGEEDSVSSRSYASILSSLSRVSHRAQHPFLPVCCLQDVRKLPRTKKRKQRKPEYMRPDPPIPNKRKKLESDIPTSTKRPQDKQGKKGKKRRKKLIVLV